MKSMLFLVFSGLILSGCSTISGMPERSYDVKNDLIMLKPYFEQDVIGIYNAKLNDDEKKRYRNEVLSARIRAIDINFNQFINGLLVENKKLSIGADSLVLALGATAAVSTVSSTQAILSATSATVTGVKSSVDKNAYYDSTLPALISQMLASRQKTLVLIYSGMKSGVRDYSLMRGLVDIEAYYQSGTIIGAVSEVNKQAGVLKSEADNEIAAIISSSYEQDDAGDLIRKFWKPDGNNINKLNEKKITSWMSANGLTGVSITVFIRGATYSVAREKAVEEIPIK